MEWRAPARPTLREMRGEFAKGQWIADAPSPIVAPCFDASSSPPACSCWSSSAPSPPSSPSTHPPRRRRWPPAIRSPVSRNGTSPSCPSRRPSRRATAHHSTIASIPAGRIAPSCWCTARPAPTSRCSSSPRRCRRPAPPSTRSACAAMAAAARPTATSPIIGQLDDDLADLVKGLGLDKPGVRRTLIGFSSGGGFVLRIAGGRQAGLFNDYLAISPYIGQDSPTNKPNSGGWAGVAVPRIIALSLLDEHRPAVVPGPARRPLRHRRQGEQQPHAGLLLPAGGEPAARPRLARRAGAHIGAHRDRGRRQRRAVQRRSVQADAAADQSAHRRDGRAERDASRHDRRSSGDGRHRRRLAKVGRRLTAG